MREAYTYIDDDRAVVTRPAAMREVETLRALRTGDASRFLDADPSGMGFTMAQHPSMRKAVDDMMVRGWKREKLEFERFKRGIWNANEEVVKKLLRDL